MANPLSGSRIGGRGGGESQFQTGCILMTMQIDAGFLALVRRDCGLEWETDGQERERAG